MVAYPQTANFKLTLPPFDTRAYDSLVNDNFKAIDAIVATYFALSNVQGTWQNSTAYVVGDKLVDGDVGLVFQCVVSHTSLASPSTFEEERITQPTYWTAPAIPARGLGVWSSGQTYEPGDFVVASNIYYAVCIASHMSGASFLGDSAFWDILIDLTGAATIPATAGHGGQYTRVKGDASGLEYVPISTLVVDLALGTLAFSNIVLGTMATQSSSNVSIGGGFVAVNIGSAAAPTLRFVGDGDTGFYHKTADVLGFASGGVETITISPTGIAGVGLGSAAPLDVGTTANKIVQLDGSAKLPAVDGSQLTGISSGRLISITEASYSANTDLTSHIPVDDTPPLIAEGTQVASVSVTTTTATEKVALEFMGPASANGDYVVVSIFRDTTLIQVGICVVSAGANVQMLAAEIIDAPAAAGTYAYTARVGGGSTTVRMNGNLSGRFFGGLGLTRFKAALIETA